jgi:hypothetical protein
MKRHAMVAVRVESRTHLIGNPLLGTKVSDHTG